MKGILLTNALLVLIGRPPGTFLETITSKGFRWTWWVDDNNYLPPSEASLQLVLSDQGVPVWCLITGEKPYEKLCSWATVLEVLDQGSTIRVRRDSMGISCVFARRFVWGWALSDSLNCLLKLDPPADPEFMALREYLFYDGWIGAELPFRGVFQLQPGCEWLLRVATQTPVLSHDGSLDFINEIGRLGCMSGMFDFNPIETALGDAMVKVAEGGRHCGVFLSGGLDSGILSSICKNRGINVTLLTCGVDDLTLDETSLACDVARHLEVPHEIYQLDQKTFLQGLVNAIDDSGLPLTLPNQVGLTLLANRAKECCIDQIFCGEGGDEIFCGYPRLLQLKKILQRDIVRIGGNYREFFTDHDLARDFQFLRSPYDLESLGFGFPARLAVTTHIRTWMSIRETDLLELELRIAWLHEFLQTLPCNMLRLHNAVRRSGVRITFPFLSKEVVRFGFEQLPKLSTLTSTKPGLRILAQRLLPEKILAAPKSGFDLPLDTWLPPLSRIAGPGICTALGLPADIIDQWSRVRYASADLRWAILNIEIWTRLFVFHQSHVNVLKWISDISFLK